MSPATCRAKGNGFRPSPASFLASESDFRPFSPDQLHRGVETDLFEELETLGAAVVHEVGVVAVGIDHDRDASRAEFAEELPVRVGLALLDEVFGIDLDHEAAFPDEVEQIQEGAAIPLGVEREARVALAVHVDLVDMAHDVDAAGLDHFHLGLEVAAHHAVDVALEEGIDGAGELGVGPVDAGHVPLLEHGAEREEVDGTDAVVEG